MNYEPFTSIENLTLAHFRHFIPKGFSSLFTLSPLYICRESSTNHLLFMQNKPNLVRRRRIANSVCTTDYENKWQRRVRKSKPNSNPIKPNLQKAKMNANVFVTKDYERNDIFLSPNKQTQFLLKPKMNVNLYIIEDYENKTAFRLKKNKPNSNPIKPKTNPVLSAVEWANFNQTQSVIRRPTVIWQTAESPERLLPAS